MAARSVPPGRDGPSLTALAKLLLLLLPTELELSKLALDETGGMLKPPLLLTADETTPAPTI